jgi:iron complex transport system permease protein
MENKRTGKRFSFTLFIAVLSLALVSVLFWGLLSGSVPLSAQKVAEGFLFILDRGGDETAAALIFKIRLPRLLLAVLVGASLGTAGACFQGLFRNSLADPYIIGSSSGAALGAALAVSVGGFPAFGFFLNLSSVFSQAAGMGICAFAGSFAAVFLAFLVSRAPGSAQRRGR